MSSIDNRVVQMEFDNKQFQAGVKETLGALDLLRRGLSLSETGVDGPNLSGMAAGVDHIANRFSALGAIGFTVIQNLTTAAMNFTKRIAGGLLEPLVGGGRRRAENIEQAMFQFRGLGMDIDATMDSALQAVTGTAFGLDEAARAAGQFGASGMEAGDDMTSALRAISGVAAMTNSSYSDTADIFTKVAGNGRVMGDDLLRMSSRGLNAAATLADSMGISEAAVREMVTAGEISFEQFYQAMDDAFGENATRANETYAGSLANLRAAFSRIGAGFFTPWLEQQRDLFNSLSPAVDAVGKALEPVIATLTGFTGRSTNNLISFIDALDFSEINQVLKPMTGIIGNIFGAISQFIGPLRDAFRQIFPPASVMEIAGIMTRIEVFTQRLSMSGDTADKFRRTMAGVFAVLGIGWEILKAGARFLADMFGIVTKGSGGFLDVTANIGDFLVALHQAVKEGNGLTKFFEGLGRVLRVPIELIRNFAHAVLGLFDFTPPSSDTITRGFEPLGRLGEMLLNIWDNVVAALGRAWEAVKRVGSGIATAFEPFRGIFDGLFDDMDFDKWIDVINTGLFGGILLMIRRFAENMGSQMGSLSHNMTRPLGQLTKTLSNMQHALKAATLIGIAIAIGILAGSMFLLSNIDAAGMARGLTAMTVMIGQLAGATKLLALTGGGAGLIGVGVGLTAVAIALGILAISVRALSKLDYEELLRGLTATMSLLGGMIIVAHSLQGMGPGLIKAGVGLTVLAVGVRILASAVKTMAELSWEELAKGLVGVGGILASLAIFTRLVAVNKAGLVQGAGLLLLAVGIRVLASAVKEFATIQWEGIAKGLVSITGILAAFAIFSQTVGNPGTLLASGAALIMIAGAMKILASAMHDFAGLSWEEMSKGLFAMAYSLAAVALTMQLMPPNMVAMAAGLVIVSLALRQIAIAVEQMGGMSWDEISRGLATLAGSLAILAIGLTAMVTALPGAAATLVAAAALRVLAPVLERFGDMSIFEIGRALGVLAGTFVVLGMAGLALAPVAPILLVLGAAIALIGVGAGVAGLGIGAMAMGLVALAAAGAAGTAAMVAFVTAVLGMIPQIARAFGLMIVEILRVIGNSISEIAAVFTQILQAIIGVIAANAPDIIRLIVQLTLDLIQALRVIIPPMARAALEIMLGVLRAMRDNVPQIVRVITQLVVSLLQELTKGVPQFVRAAVDLMVAFLRALEGEIGRVVTAGTDVVIALIRGISENMVRIADEGGKAVIAFINGVANSIRNNSEQLRQAGRNLAGAIISGMTGGLSGGIGTVVSGARRLATNAVSAVRGVFRSSSPSKVFHDIGLDVGDGLSNGIVRSIPVVEKATEHMGKDAIRKMKESMAALSEAMDVDPNMHPTITPVLDLSLFDKDASRIAHTLSDQKIDLDMAYSKASNASRAQQANTLAQRVAQVEEQESAPTVTYNQYNQSPKALTTAEIYRQTKNQLAVTKGALMP